MQPREKTQSTGSPIAATSPSTQVIAWTGETPNVNVIAYPSLQSETLKPQSSYAPSLAVSPSNNLLYLAWTNKSSPSYVNYATSSDGKSYSPSTQITYLASSAAPSLTVFNNAVYVAWRGSDGTLNIMPISGTTPSQPAWTGADAPALGTLNNSVLYVGWRDSKDNLWYMTSTDGINFTTPVELKQTSPHAPAFVEFNGFLYIAWTGNGDNHLNVMRIVDTKPVTLGETSSCAPTLSVAGGLLYIGWVGSDPNNVLNVLSSTDAIHFGSKAEIQETTNAGLSMVAFAGN
ncbi:MAG TPA: hypothetical protein VGV87_27110 [Blastocatellia bacterium]|nr:hypothetical protein [Blastocatellia bacterium]